MTGANGSGKSTLLRLLHGQLRPASAARSVGPRSATTQRLDAAPASRLGIARAASGLSVSDDRARLRRVGLRVELGLTRAPTALESDRVDELLAEFSLDALATRLLTTLSYGQARRALIARALVNRPRLLLLDEPWEGLDEDASAVLNRALAATIVHGTQLVCASHLAAHRELFTHEIAIEPGGSAHAAVIAT